MRLYPLRRLPSNLQWSLRFHFSSLSNTIGILADSGFRPPRAIHHVAAPIYCFQLSHGGMSWDSFGRLRTINRPCLEPLSLKGLEPIKDGWTLLLLK